MWVLRRALPRKGCAMHVMRGNAKRGEHDKQFWGRRKHASDTKV